MAVMMLTLASMLLLGGIMNHQVGAEGAGGPHQGLGGAGVPASITQGGPVVDTRAGAQRSYAVQPGKVALTFDDGPDGTWTPQVLAVLTKHHVPGTFFVIGAHVADDPGLVRAEVADGDEVGIHTFTHDDLATAPAWRRSLEFSQTQSAIAGATGISTPLLRPPYSSEPDAVDRLDWAAIQDAGRHGYLVVLTDRDSEDWQRLGVQKILDASIPPAPAAPPAGRKAAPPPGFVLMMHDGGGDRSETVAALDRLIPALQARGYSFDTVTGAVGAPSPLAPANTSARWKGKGLIFAVQASDFVVHWLGWAVLMSGIIGGVRVVILLVAARRHKKARTRRWGPAVTRPVSVIVPAYNEEAGIRATVESLSASVHPIEIIVVDDGSTDGTAAVVQELIRHRHPGRPPLRLISQANGGKPAALNTGAAAARGDLLVMMDGDTVFEPKTIAWLVQPFADPSVGAVSGNAKVGNRKGILGRWQHIEYVVGFNLERRLYDLAGCMPTVPGAVGAFRREALARVGGVSDDTLAEDTDLTMAVIRDGWRAVYEERAIAWTEAPSSLRQFWRQRYRWCYGTMQAMWKHRRSVLRRGPEGKLGRRGLTYMLLFQVLMPLLAPIVDVFALYGLIFNDAARVGAVWLAFLAVQVVMALYAFKLDRERPTALWTLPLQQVVYRQLMYLVVIHSLVTAVVGSRLRWQRMQRYGSLSGTPAAGQQHV
ncbi:cellulose synthase/poly-beta-1,6-N-acetylglucosamine synthase-like glycosyltransferase/peptidoglycan/xylan/chitin deacetylase (PgdA/CDA1 family) [Catenulispora sp. GAS73]|uniref:bifunctional polysaccharide deacetylase/glycosyltransferase family 2 protein n=1 Tax=Catenulispora sp. GAS73 TaxID=3156269 RepID=UPI0035185C63